MWLNDEDKNSKFFHRVVRGRQRQNFISSVATPKGRKEEVEEVERGVRDFFKENFKKEGSVRPIFSGLDFEKLSNRNNQELEKLFIEEEIKEALWNCNGSKSPSPDGFSFGFFSGLLGDN
ncbi:unnamed protein product [Lathyrus sativus]|nr:unnamed protein product [Lathyrus sativus]